MLQIQRLLTAYRPSFILMGETTMSAIVTLDAELARSVEGIVATAPIDALR